jgi:hypothetical protein
LLHVPSNQKEGFLSVRNGFSWSPLQGSCVELAGESSQFVLLPRKGELLAQDIITIRGIKLLIFAVLEV